ncbi:MAG: UxaA family hydrolase [Vicinamibacterales bacterium]
MTQGDERPVPGEPATSEWRAEGVKVIVITPRDNVATALEPLSPGQTIDVDGRRIEVREPIANGHKIALTRIASGEPVVKYGSPIGTATADIEAGAHVHIHNVASSRGRGDLPVNEIGPPL